MNRSLLWLAGPAVAILLIAFFGWAGPVPGLFFWAAFTGLIFLVGTPILQLALLHTSKFEGRHATACGVALATATCCAAAAWLSGAFNFW
jgi:hypothetical protein